MNRIIYLGRFTPLGGGVTNKNAGLYALLSAKRPITRIDLTRIHSGSIGTLFSTIAALFGRNNVLVIGTARKMRRAFTQILYRFNRGTMRRSLLIVMGGQFAGIVAKDVSYQTWVRHYRQIFVETRSMEKKLKQLGFENVALFPNCRQRPRTEIAVRPREGKLKCVCFSMIYPEKGIDTALQSAALLPNVQFDFWGIIREDYKVEFLSEIDSLPNCHYHGLFQVDGDNVYDMLNQYDLLLFPTRCVGEGVPGTLIEAKIAALPAVVSDCAYNAELVEDGVAGIVMKENTAECLMECIRRIETDDGLLTALKAGARESGGEYYYDAYIEYLLDKLDFGKEHEIKRTQ